MTLTCNQCGAPLVITDPNLPFVSCGYCQTATAMPARPAPPPEPPRRPTPVPGRAPRRSDASSQRNKQRGRGPNPTAFMLGKAVRALAMPAGVAMVVGWFAWSRGLFDPFIASLDGAAAPPPRATVLATEVSTVEASPVTLPTEVVNPVKPQPAPKKAGARSAKGTSPSPGASATGALVPPPSPPLRLKLTISSVKLEGKSSYPKDQVRAGLTSAQGGFRTCYASALAQDRTLAGQMDMGFQIAADGGTRGVGVTNPTVPSSLSTCVTRVLSVQRFAKPEDGGAVPVRFLLRLASES